MEWQRLDIRKASILKKQVDLGLAALKIAINEGDAQARGALIESFLVQIDEIEEFRSMNDSDERSILFERERLRLRKAVQEFSAPASASGSTPSSSSKANMTRNTSSIAPSAPSASHVTNPPTVISTPSTRALL